MTTDLINDRNKIDWQRRFQKGIAMRFNQLAKFGIVTAFVFLDLVGGCGTIRKNTEVAQSPPLPLQEETAPELPKLSKEDLLERFGKKIPSCDLDRFEGRDARMNEKSKTLVSLSDEQSNRVIVKNKNTLVACFERAVKKGAVSDEEDLHLQFEITINKKGLVTEVDISGDRPMDDSLRRCLARRVQNWTFPRSNGKSLLSFPFLFARG